MKYLNLIIAALVIPEGVSAIRKEPAKERGSLLRMFDNSNNQRTLKGEDKCPKSDKEEVYYNAIFELDDVGDKALGTCDDGQMFEIGEMIRDITVEVDEGFPDIATDVIKIETEVCTVPCIWAEEHPKSGTDTNRRRLGSRTYTYTSGGTCRRCSSRRLLVEDVPNKQLRGRDLGDDPTPSEMAQEACNLAQVAQFAFTDGQADVAKVNEILADMEGQSDHDDYVKKCKEVSNIAADMVKKLEGCVDDIDLALKACSDASEAALNNEEGKTKDCLKDAEDAAKDAMENLDKVKDKTSEAKKKQIEAREKLLKLDAEEAKERTKAVIEAKKAEIKAIEEALDAQLKEAKEEGKEALQRIKAQVDARKASLHAEQTRFEKEQAEADKYAQELAGLLLNAEFANNYAEWMQAYKECLEIVIKYELERVYHDGTGTGCIQKYDPSDNNKRIKWGVVVSFDVKDTEDDTLQETCKRADGNVGVNCTEFDCPDGGP